MKTLKNIWDYLTDNPTIATLFLPIAIYNIIYSYRENLKQQKILVNVINSNEDFFKALATYGFEKNKLFSLSAKFETNLEMEPDEIYDMANKTVILTIKNFVKDEMLFNIIKIEGYRSQETEVTIEINTASRLLFILDIKILYLSFILTSGITLLTSLLISLFL